MEGCQRKQLSKRLAALARDTDRLQKRFHGLKHLIFPPHNALIKESIGAEEKAIIGALDQLAQNARCASDWQRHPVKPGPKTSRWYCSFFCVVADAYQDAGGCVSAAEQRDKGRNSPFMRFLLYLHQRLPRERSDLAPKALAEWAHKTEIPNWKRSRSKQG
jgi:hypothetical protein